MIALIGLEPPSENSNLRFEEFTSLEPFLLTRCRVERSLLWEITGSLAAAGNDLRVGNQLLFSKTKIIIKQTVFNRAHTKDPRPTSSIQC